MNLLWIAGLTVFVAFEKFAGETIAKAVAVLLVSGGGLLIAIG